MSLMVGRHGCQSRRPSAARSSGDRTCRGPSCDRGKRAPARSGDVRSEGGGEVPVTGSVADAGVLPVRSPTHEAQRNRSPFAFLPWAIAGAWTVAIVAWARGWGHTLGHDHLIEHGPPLWMALLLFLAGWQVMVVAMMLPSSLPVFRSFNVLTVDLRDRRSVGVA